MPAEELPVRERILDAALALLRDASVKKLAQPQVARAAGVPQGHLTYYFPKRLDLLLAVGRRFTELVRSELVPAVEGSAFAIVSKLAKDRDRSRTLLRLLVEADGDAKLRDAMGEGGAFARSAVARALDKPEGDLDVDVTLAMLWGLGLSHLVFARTDADTDRVLARMRQWIDVMRDEPAQRAR